MIKFISLASGSSGNCYYIATPQTTLLIDAGIGVRTIKKYFKELDIPFTSINAVLVTHDHADHIKSVGNLGEKYNIPIYATKETHLGINRSYCMTEKLKTSAHYLEKENTIEIGDFKITAFEVPHDGTDNVGYYIEAENKHFCFVTDIGHITDTATKYICRANYLILEANYDEEMLRMGRYPAYLKERIAGLNGHLSNIEAAEFIAEHFSEQLKYVWLCHLSKDNNHPELAYKTFECKLREKGLVIGENLQVIPLRRNLPSEIYEFE